MRQVGKTINDKGEVLEVFECDYCEFRTTNAKNLKDHESNCGDNIPSTTGKKEVISKTCDVGGGSPLSPPPPPINNEDEVYKLLQDLDFVKGGYEHEILTSRLKLAFIYGGLKALGKLEGGKA